MKKTESLFSQLHKANQQNQELQIQLEIARLEAKDNLDHANIIRHDYTQLKEAADDMVKQIDEFYQGTDNADEFLTALENYKQTNIKMDGMKLLKEQRTI